MFFQKGGKTISIRHTDDGIAVTKTHIQPDGTTTVNVIKKKSQDSNRIRDKVLSAGYSEKIDETLAAAVSPTLDGGARATPKAKAKSKATTKSKTGKPSTGQSKISQKLQEDGIVYLRKDVSKDTFEEIELNRNGRQIHSVNHVSTFDPKNPEKVLEEHKGFKMTFEFDSYIECLNTQLRAAIAANNSEQALKLLDEGANPNQVHYGNDKEPLYSLIHSATRNHNNDLIKILVKYGANINDINSRNGRTPLISAIMFASIDNAVEKRKALTTIKTLVALGANKFVKDTKGKTAVDYARDKKRFNQIEDFLVALGEEAS